MDRIDPKPSAQRHGRVLALAAAGLVALAPGMARAQTCAAQVHDLAGHYDLDLSTPQARSEGDNLAGNATPPATEESRGVPSSEGSTSQVPPGGVIRPPDTGAPIAVPAPSTGPNSMPTAPPLDSPSAKADEKASGLDAEQRARIESLLMAADSAASRGDETACQARLSEARALTAGKNGS
jgi:hypothetical protein